MGVDENGVILSPGVIYEFDEAQWAAARSDGRLGYDPGASRRMIGANACQVPIGWEPTEEDLSSRTASIDIRC